MIKFPIAKVNLGLNIVERRDDGYHNLETVFYPVPITDALEVLPMDERFPIGDDCTIALSGIGVKGEVMDNLVVKAYKLLASRYELPRVHIHLHKHIPTQAGMGGGSSDAAVMISLLNEMCELGMTVTEMREVATRLGADCPFFITGEPSYAEGIGEKLQPIALNLSGWKMVVIHPHIPVPTKEAFALITPHRPEVNCRVAVMQPVSEWRHCLFNDFEESVFAQHPESAIIRSWLYDNGAVYASMSGSGSSLFALMPAAAEHIDTTTLERRIGHIFDCYEMVL